MDNPKLVFNYITNAFLIVASYTLDVPSQEGATFRMGDTFVYRVRKRLL